MAVQPCMEEIEVCGRKLRLMWHFWNGHQEFNINPFKKKSKFNPKGDAAREICLSCLEENILSLHEKISYSNPVKKGWGVGDPLYLIPSLL